MLIAFTHAPAGTPGKPVLILGLQAENMRRLANDEPIRQDLAQYLEGAPADVLDLRIRDLVLYVLGPEDTARLAAQAGQELPQ
jgi:hypothetical protein